MIWKSVGTVMVLALVGGSALGQEKTQYLTGDGNLAETLVVKVTQSGFAGVTGTVFTIQPSGEWTRGQLLQGKVKNEATGKLSREQMAALAGELAKFDLAKLDAKRNPKPMANPKAVHVQWGKREVILDMGAGEAMAKVDAATLEGRYAGIVQAVESRLDKKKAEK